MAATSDSDLLAKVQAVKNAILAVRQNYYERRRQVLLDALTSLGASVSALGTPSYVIPTQSTASGVQATPTPQGTPTTQANVNNTQSNPYQPNSDGTLTWQGVGYYYLGNSQANGNNPAGTYRVDNQAFITAYNDNLRTQSQSAPTTTPSSVAPPAPSQASQAAPGNQGITVQVPTSIQPSGTATYQTNAPSTAAIAAGTSIYGSFSPQGVSVTDANVATTTTGIGTSVPNSPIGSTVQASTTGWFKVTVPTGEVVYTKINPLKS